MRRQSITEPEMLTGQESFTSGAVPLGFDVRDFWRWSASSLLDNTLRGVLAEFLVAKAIGAKEKIRQEWQPWDLTSLSGLKVEVKSSAYLQNWKQSKPAVIRFGIQPSFAWDASHGEYGVECRRHANYYVFCLFAGTDFDSAQPLDLSQWRFWVLPTSVLDTRCPKQKSIGLAALQKLGAKECSWHELRALPQW